jgi:hypothetical protein
MEMASAFNSDWDRQWMRQYCRRSHTSINKGSATVNGLWNPTISRSPRMTPAYRRKYQKAMMRAAQIVCRAIKDGKLKSLKDGDVLCVDCGIRPAINYEHRDYAKPLEVEPICRRCNMQRGPAVLSSSVPTRQTAQKRLVPVQTTSYAEAK